MSDASRVVRRTGAQEIHHSAPPLHGATFLSLDASQSAAENKKYQRRTAVGNSVAFLVDALGVQAPGGFQDFGARKIVGPSPPLPLCARPSRISSCAATISPPSPRPSSLSRPESCFSVRRVQPSFFLSRSVEHRPHPYKQTGRSIK